MRNSFSIQSCTWLPTSPQCYIESEHVCQFLHGKPDGPVKFHFQAPDYQADLQESVK